MCNRSCKIFLLPGCVIFSLLAHLLGMQALRLFGTYDFGAPVNSPRWLMVDLAAPQAASAKAATIARDSDRKQVEADLPLVAGGSPRPETDGSDLPPAPEPRRPGEKSQQVPVAAAPVTTPLSRSSETIPAAAGVSPRPLQEQPTLSPPGTGSAFLTAKYEKLTYQITMLGIPVGSAELESKYANGETTITLRIASNMAFSSIYPVADLVEIRHVGGGFIMAKIRQQEGSFRSDELFTINPGKKRVSWFDNINGRSLQLTVPSADVVDTLSAIYYLRNRQLTVGQTETVHVFDSESYADVPVEILSREELRLPNLTKVNTLVVRPLQQTAGIFRRTGEALIWMTDDDNKVPVKIVTSIPLGKVTVELVAAESKPHDGDQTVIAGSETSGWRAIRPQQ
jgi:hypothetical protein